MGAINAEILLSQQVILLLGQIIELKVEVALLRGKPLAEAVEEAFLFLEVSPLLSELFDEEHLAIYKKEQLRYFNARQAAPSEPSVSRSS